MSITGKLSKDLHFMKPKFFFFSLLIMVLVSSLYLGLHTLKGYYAERQGERDDMQDAHTIIDDLAIQISNIDESM